MTDEQLDERESALIEVKQLLAEGKGTINGPLVDSLVDNELRLITALRAEREAHQATKAELERYRKRADELQRAYRKALDAACAEQAELEAAREVVEIVRRQVPNRQDHTVIDAHLQSFWKAMDIYDAARAGQEAGAE